MTDTTTPQDDAPDNIGDAPDAPQGPTVTLPAEHFDYLFALARKGADGTGAARLRHAHLDTIWGAATRDGAPGAADDRFSDARLTDIKGDGTADPIARKIAEQLRSLPLALREPMWQQARGYASGGEMALGWLTSSVRTYQLDSLFGAPAPEARP